MADPAPENKHGKASQSLPDHGLRDVPSQYVVIPQKRLSLTQPLLLFLLFVLLVIIVVLLLSQSSGNKNNIYVTATPIPTTTEGNVGTPTVTGTIVTGSVTVTTTPSPTVNPSLTTTPTYTIQKD